MKQLAQNALDVQSASNLSGIIHSFSSDISDLRSLLTQAAKSQEEAPGTDDINSHPVCVLYSAQISFLTKTSPVGCEDVELYRKAYEWAKKQVEN